MTRTNPHNPDLSIWATGFKAIAGSNLALIDFKISGFDVDRDNLAVVAFLNLLAYLRFINLIAASSKFFFAVPGLSDCHQFYLAAICPFYFSLRHYLKQQSKKPCVLNGY
jgi:hypothetical protein